MLEADRPAFERILRELFGALDKPLTEHQCNAFWKGLSRMSLAEFERCRDQILRELEDGEPPRRFGVDSIWAAKQRLRASAAPEPYKAPDDGWRGDRWDIAANRHLLGHITRQLAINSQRYGRPATYHGLKTLMTPNADASPEFVRNVHVLVEHKKRWAATMREIDAANGGNGIPVDEQREVWAECMRLAEAQISNGAPEEAA
jgi:hypothetical protein